MGWYHSGQFASEPLKARELEIQKLEKAISLQDDKMEIVDLKRKVEYLKSIPDEKVGVCSVCYAVYDTRYSYSVCSDSCFRDKFM